VPLAVPAGPVSPGAVPQAGRGATTSEDRRTPPNYSPGKVGAATA
jgi:hypothetical protein